MKRLFYSFIGVVFTVCVIVVPYAAADVAVNIVVANPSDEEVQTVPVEYLLPPDLKKDDIVDSAGLKIDYNVDQGTYYVHGELELKAKEVKTLKIIIKDIWNIPQSNFDRLHNMLENKMTALESSVDPKTLNDAKSGITGRIAYVIKAQKDAADNIEKRIQMFSKNRDMLSNIKGDIFALDRLKNVEETKPEEIGTVGLIIEGENVSDKEVNMPIKYYLPKEITSQYLEETGGLEIKHDPIKDQLYLFKEEIFAPMETKRYQIRIKNVWKISEDLVNSYVDEAAQLNEKLADSENAETAQLLYESIKENADAIISTQTTAESVKAFISTFRVNKKRLRAIKDDIEKLRTLQQEVNTEDMRGIRNVVREMDYFNRVKDLSDKIFVGMLEKGAVWRIILIIVIFLIVFTTLFYGIWFINLKKDESQEMEKLQ